MKHSIWFRLAKSLRKGQAIFDTEFQQDPGHVLNVIHGLAYGVPLSMAALNNGAKSQISTFLQRLNFHRQDISCHAGNIVAGVTKQFNINMTITMPRCPWALCRSILGEKEQE